MIVVKAKLIKINTKHQMNTALLAAAYAIDIFLRCSGSKKLKSGAAKLSSARYCNSSGRELLRVLASKAPEVANETAAPKLRRVLRLEVTTARCSFGQ